MCGDLLIGSAPYLLDQRGRKVKRVILLAFADGFLICV